MTNLLGSARFKRRILGGALAALTASQAALPAAAQASIWADRRPPAISAGPLPALPLSPRFAQLQTQLGTVRPRPAGDRGVLIVQDVHLHAEAQTAVSSLIGAQAGQIDLVALEAEFAPLRLDAYANFSCRRSIRAAADHLLARSRISGAVHGVLLADRRLAVTGVDDRSLYAENVGAVRSGSAVSTAAARDVETRLRDLERRRPGVFSAALLSADDRIAAHRGGTASLPNHVAFLLSRGRSSILAGYLSAARLERAVDWIAVDAERRRYAARLGAKAPHAASALTEAAIAHRAGRISAAEFHDLLFSLGERAGVASRDFPALSAYRRYADAAARIDVDDVLAETARLEEEIVGSLARSESERNLLADLEAARLARLMVRHELVPGGWQRYKSVRARLPGGLRRTLAPFDAFYDLAERRDAAMADNLLRRFVESGARRAVLVVGGFHVPGISRRLKDAGLPVFVFTPALSRLPDGRALNAFLSERTPLERLFRSRRLTLSPPHLPPAVAHAELPALVAAGEAVDGHLSGDAGPFLRSLEPAAGVEAAVERRPGGAIVHLGLDGRKWDLNVRGDGTRIDESELVSAPPTASLVANVFGTRVWSGRLRPLNWIVRLLLLGAIVPHEIGHLIAGPREGRRLDHGARRLALGLLAGMPWFTRGPPKLVGLAVNAALVAGLWALAGSAGTAVFDPTTVGGVALIYLASANIAFLALEIGLTPFARRLGISTSPDLYFLDNGDVLRMERPGRGRAVRKHAPVPDVANVPPRYQNEAAKAVSDLYRLRPSVGLISFGDGAPQLGTPAHESAHVSWDVFGNISIKSAVFRWALDGRSSGELHVPPGESPVYRAIIIAALQAAYELQNWNRHVIAATPNDFDAWKREAEERFNPRSPLSSQDLLRLYERLFESPKSMAVQKISWAASVLHLSERETIQTVEPDWVYRFEIPVLMDDDATIERFIGWRSHHNDANGQNKGGFRYAAGLDAEKSVDLSREMSIKTAVVNLPLGGGKGGVRIDVEKFKNRPVVLARLTRGYARHLHKVGAIGPEIDVPAPDMNTNGQTMAWAEDEYLLAEISAGRLTHPELVAAAAVPAADATATPILDLYHDLWLRGEVDGRPLAAFTGKPVDKGGIIGRDEATARGVFYVTQESVRHYLGRRDLRGLRFSVQGFGNVGYFTAKILHDAGGIIVSTSERFGAAHNPRGLDIDALKAYYDEKKTFAGFSQPGTVVATGDTVGDQPLYQAADVLIPAALEEQIREDNAGKIHPDVKIVVEAANNPTTPAAEALLRRARPDLVIVPDVLANAGGVTVSHFEWQRNMGQLPRDIKIETIRELLREVLVPATRELLKVARDKKISPREATYVVAVRRVHQNGNSGAHGATWLWSRLWSWGRSNNGSPLHLMPWLFERAYGAVAHRPLAATAVAAAGGFVEETVVRAALQTVMAAALLPWIGPAAAFAAPAIYALLFATLLHRRVLHAGGDGTPERARPIDRVRLFASSFAIGLAAAALPLSSANAFLALGAIHAAGNAAKSLLAFARERGVPGARERRAAAVAARWIEARASGRASRAPIEDLLSAFTPDEWNLRLSSVDGRVPVSAPAFDRALFERLLGERLRSSPRFRSAGARALRAVNEAASLTAADAERHPAALPDRRLTVLVVDDSLGEDAARAAVDDYLRQHRRAASGRTVLMASGGALAYAAQAASGLPRVDLVTDQGEGAVALRHVDATLRSLGAFDGAASVRFAVASARAVDTDGLADDSPLRRALFLLLDQALRAAALTFGRLESALRVARLAGVQA